MLAAITARRRTRSIGQDLRQTRTVAGPVGLNDEDPDANRKPPKAISPTDPCSAWQRRTSVYSLATASTT